MRAPITIIGGGLAGLTLGILLRRRGVPATVWEAGHYPRHRVCGEFISGHGLKILSDLGIRETLESVGGAREASDCAFFSERRLLGVRRLPSPALCVSRYRLDETLAGEFRRAGGELKEGCRWRDEPGEGTVRATGRRIEAPGGHWRWFGLKAHVRGVELDAGLEMHFHRRGYIGLCRVDGDAVNICGLFRTETPVPGLAENWREWLFGSPGTILERRMGGAAVVSGSFCSVAGLSLSPGSALEQPGCCVGDSISMPAPVTGNGMSMAFESAVVAAAPLADYSGGAVSWVETRRRIARDSDRRFLARLRWTELLQRMLFIPVGREVMIRMALRLPGAWRLLVSRTR